MFCRSTPSNDITLVLVLRLSRRLTSPLWPWSWSCPWPWPRTDSAESRCRLLTLRRRELFSTVVCCIDLFASCPDTFEYCLNTGTARPHGEDTTTKNNLRFISQSSRLSWILKDHKLTLFQIYHLCSHLLTVGPKIWGKCPPPTNLLASSSFWARDKTVEPWRIATANNKDTFFNSYAFTNCCDRHRQAVTTMHC